MSKPVNYKTVADISWNVWINDNGTAEHHQIQTAMLIDISRQLRKLNATLDCPNTREIPGLLRRISANTHKPKRRRKR